MITTAPTERVTEMAAPKLERDWVRRALIIDLATSGDTQVKLARKYGVANSSLTEFKQRHADEIAAEREAGLEEFAGILIADKANRLAIYEELLEVARAKGDERSALRILRNVAEEMGHLPQRIQMGGEVGVRTSYEIVGVDPEALK
jgi:transposase-like protein